MSEIDKKYAQLGGANGFLGNPAGNETTCPDGVGRFRHYQGGSIYWHPQTGAHEVHGDIRKKWSELGWEKSFLGYPTTDETATPDKVGRFNHFQGGSIYWHPQTGAHEVHGDIRKKWSELGWEKSFLGYPTTDETATPDKVGRFNHFQGGSIYWHPQTGAHEVHGDIRKKWSELGWEKSFLGYPTTDETATPDKVGRFNHFQGGSIYWHPQTGAHEVHGDIRKKWSELGWEKSFLGYPTSDELMVADNIGRANSFQNGWIYRTPLTGAQEIHGAALQKWLEMGGVYSELGYPTSDDKAEGGGMPVLSRIKKEFQHGALHWQLPVVAGTPPTFEVRLTNPNPKVSVLRPEDLLALTFELVNLKVAANPARLERATAGKDAFIIMHFPPQNIAEEAFFETALDQNGKGVKADPPDPDQPDEKKLHEVSEGILKKLPIAQTRLSGPSRLVFKVPAGTNAIAFTLNDILTSCQKFELNVAAAALPPPLLRRMSFSVNTSVYEVLAHGISGAPAPTLRLTTNFRAQVWAKRSGVARVNLARGSDNLVAADLDKIRTAARTITPKIRIPALTETAIEAPYRLIISPNKYAAWVHSPGPAAKSGRTELWHTRLATRTGGGVDEDDNDLRTLRAIWTRSGSGAGEGFDPNNPAGWPKHANSPFRMSLDAFDRHNLVHLSSNFGLKQIDDIHPYVPEPIACDQLMLSALGGWINVRGAWEKLPQGLSVEEWRHRGTMARDHYVRVVYQGFLFPFSHRASLIKITERKLHADLPGNPAYLRQRMYIVVREPEKKFRNTGYTIAEDFLANEKDIKEKNIKLDLQMPFTRVRITTLVTPNLNPPEDSDIDGALQSAFWPRVAYKEGNQVTHQDFLFHLIAEDIEGHELDLAMPLLFVGKEINDKEYQEKLAMPAIALHYEHPGNKDRRQRPLHGQTVTFADSTKPGETAFETKSITFGVQLPDHEPDEKKFKPFPPGEPKFFPVVRNAEVFIPAMKHLAGNNSAATIAYDAEYLKVGFTTEGNRGQVFAKLVSKTTLDFNQVGDRAGGLLKPNMNISGLSRLMGPVAGDLAMIRNNKFNPAEFFKDIDAKLFGVMNLSDIIEPAGIVSDLAAVPKFIAETLTVMESFLHDLNIFEKYLALLKNETGALKTVATNLASDVDKIQEALEKKNLEAAKNALNTFKTRLDNLAKFLPTAKNLGEAAKNDLEKKLNRFKELLKNPAAFFVDVADFINAVEAAKELAVRFEWQPKLRPWPDTDKVKEQLFHANGDTKMTIAVERRAKTDGKTGPEVDVFCSLENFSLQLIPPEVFLKIHFDKLHFIASPGKKPDVNVVIREIEFVGKLAFVETLSSLIPLDGFSDPPSIDVTPRGITAGYTVSLPTLAIGMFSLQNISLAAGFRIPFIADPLSFHFRFCERHAPFLLTVSGLGGGGYFGLTVNTNKVELEAALEFGGNIAFNFGAASGGVFVMAGIAFTMTTEEREINGIKKNVEIVELGGYLRMGGVVEVLGLVCVSIEMRMILEYNLGNGKLVGEASITVEIELAFFSESVEIYCQRTFAGAAGDPTFAQVMEKDKADSQYFPWQEYCQAFA